MQIVCDKELISKVYQDPPQINSKKQPDFKSVKDLNRHFSKDDMQMANGIQENA